MVTLYLSRKSTPLLGFLDEYRLPKVGLSHFVSNTIIVKKNIVFFFRTPASFCGIFGHKPSPLTVSLTGAYIHDNSDPDTNIQTLGPMSRHAGDLLPLMNILMGDNKHLLRLDADVALSKCNFYILTTQIGGHLTSMLDPEVKQALNMVRQSQSL